MCEDRSMSSKYRKANAAMLLALVGASANAMTVSAWTPTTTPKYYYGTYNAVNYSARPASGERVSSLKLFVGGEETKTITNQNGFIKPMVIGVVFDSTHFPVNPSGAYPDCETHVEVNYQKLIGGAWVSQPPILNAGSTTIKIKNRSLIATLGQAPFNALIPMTTLHLGDVIVTGNGSGTNGEKPRLLNANISVNLLGPFNPPFSGTPDLWTFGDVLNNTSPNHIVIINTHGHATLPKMADGTGAFSFDASTWFNRVVSDFGTDHNAPFNSAAVPPVNLLVLACCMQGGFIDSDWFGVHWPYINDFLGPSMTNQACVGFNVAINGYKVPQIMDTILGDMAVNNETLGVAIANFLVSDANDTDMVSTGMDSNGEPLGTLRQMVAGDFKVMGDNYMRIHGLYTGSNAIASGWWQ